MLPRAPSPPWSDTEASCRAYAGFDAGGEREAGKVAKLVQSFASTLSTAEIERGLRELVEGSS
jgi:hypothetical protein